MLAILRAVFGWTVISISLSSPALAQVPSWELVRVDTSGATADDNEEIGLSWVTDMALRADTVFVLQRQTDELAVFSPTGIHLRTIGRSGRGPGEFMAPTKTGALDGMIWVADPSEARLTVFEPEGNVRTIPGNLQLQQGRRYSVAGLLTGEDILAELIAPDGMVASGEMTSDLLIRHDPETGAVDTLAVLDREGTMLTIQGTRSRISMRQPIYDGSHYAIDPEGSQLAVLRQGGPRNRDDPTFTIDWVSTRGDTLRSRSYRRSGRELSDSVRNDLISDLAAALAARGTFPSPDAARDAVEEQLYLPPVLPPVSDIFYGEDGTLWIRHEERPGSKVQYTVLSSTGEVVAVLEVPSQVTLLVSNKDRVWGRFVGDMDVNVVVQYEIHR